MKLFTRRNHVIDLRDADEDDVMGFSMVLSDHDVARDVQRWYPAGVRPVFGAPSRCPGCGDYGMVLHVDARAGRTDNSCRACGATWQLTRRALAALTDDAPVTAQALGGGVLLAGLTGLAGARQPATAGHWG